MIINRKNFPLLYNDSTVKVLEPSFFDDMDAEGKRIYQLCAEMSVRTLSSAKKYIVSQWVLDHIRDNFAAYSRTINEAPFYSSSGVFIFRSGAINTVHIHVKEGTNQPLITVGTYAGNDLIRVDAGVIKEKDGKRGLFLTSQNFDDLGTGNILHAMTLVLFRDFADIEQVEISSSEKGRSRKHRRLEGMEQTRGVFNEDPIDAVYLNARWIREYRGQSEVQPFPRMQACGKNWADRKLVIVKGHTRTYRSKPGREKVRTK